MIKVSDLMVKDVIVASPKERAVDAAKKMKATGVSSLIVTEGDEVKGIVTRSDFIDRVVAEARDPNSTTVEDVMTKDVVTIDAEAGIMEALKLMKKYRYSQLPVIKDGKLVGVIALSDALNYIAKFFLASGWGQT
jgi:CBS domain-containing protein